MISFSTAPLPKMNAAEVLKKDLPIQDIYQQPSHRQPGYQQACTHLSHQTARYNMIPEKIAQVQQCHDSIAAFQSTVSDFAEFCGSTLNLGDHPTQKTHIQVLQQAYRTLIFKTQGQRFLFSGCRGDVAPFAHLDSHTHMTHYQGSTTPHAVTWGDTNNVESYLFPRMTEVTSHGHTLHDMWSLSHDLDQMTHVEDTQTWFDKNQPILQDIQALLHRWQEASHQALGRLEHYKERAETHLHQAKEAKAQGEEPLLSQEDMAVHLNALKKQQSKDILEKELMRHRFVQRLALYR